MPDSLTETVPADAPVIWQPGRDQPQPIWTRPTLVQSMLRGARGLCPACGQMHLFTGYLKVARECQSCHTPLGDVRADDAPPYFTIFLVGHLLAPLIFMVETTFHPALWLQAALWLPASVVMTLGLLRPVKGATLGVMLKLNMVDPGEP